MSCDNSMFFILENFIENSFIYVFGFLSGACAMMVYSDFRRKDSFNQLISMLPNLFDVSTFDDLTHILDGCIAKLNAACRYTSANTPMPNQDDTNVPNHTPDNTSTSTEDCISTVREISQTINSMTIKLNDLYEAATSTTPISKKDDDNEQEINNEEEHIQLLVP